MGKGKGKKGKRDEKLAARAAKKEARAARKALQTPKKPRSERASKPLSERKKITLDLKPVVATPTGAKWPALFKKHLGVLEAHIKTLDRVVQSMKSAMGNMEPEEREAWVRGEKGNWVVLCGLIDRARELLASARLGAKGILPDRLLKDKKGLGVIGINWEPQKLVFTTNEKSESGVYETAKTTEEVLEDAEMSDVSDDSMSSSTESSSSSEDDEPAPAPFVPLNISKATVKGDGPDSGEAAVESNPYFMVDTNPTPVVLNETTIKKSKKRAKEDDEEKPAKKVKKSKKEKTATPAAESEVATTVAEKERVNFAAVEAQLQAEVEAGLKAKAAEAEAAEEAATEEAKVEKKEKKEKKKRRRSEVSEGGEGDGEEVVEKKAKKERKEKKEKKEKEEKNIDNEVEVPEKKEKKDKKEKKKRQRRRSEKPRTMRTKRPFQSRRLLRRRGSIGRRRYRVRLCIYLNFVSCLARYIGVALQEPNMNTLFDSSCQNLIIVWLLLTVISL